MKIDDRYVGDTTPLVLWLYEVEDKKEIPLKISSETTLIEFKIKKDDDATITLNGENGTDEGRLEVPFLVDTVVDGEYVFNVKVTYSGGKTKIFDDGIMAVKPSI